MPSYNHAFIYRRNTEIQGLTRKITPKHSHQQMTEFPYMGRQNCDPTVIHSSIALLQERFRQLERAKEMRQQRQILRLFSDAEQVEPAKAYEQSRTFFQSELIRPSWQSSQDTFYLQPDKHAEFQINEAPNSVNLWSRNRGMHVRSNSDEPDIDTSLHL